MAKNKLVINGNKASMITNFKLTKKGIVIDFYPAPENLPFRPGDTIEKPYNFPKKERIMRLVFKNMQSMDIFLNNLKSFRDTALYNAGVSSGKQYFDQFMKLALEELKRQKPEEKSDNLQSDIKEDKVE